MCAGYKIYGGQKFGNYDIIKKTFFNMPNHTEVEIYFYMLKIDNWYNGVFNFLVDGVNYYNKTFGNEGTNLCGKYGNEKIQYVSAVVSSHTNSTLILEFQSFLNFDVSQASYGIFDLEIYIINNCHGHLYCQTCNDSNPNICITCPIFSKLNSDGSCGCDDPFYMESKYFAHCVRCDITCASCVGPYPSNCTSCLKNDTLINGICVPPTSLLNIFFIIIYFSIKTYRSIEITY